MAILALIFSAFALGFSAVAMFTSPRAIGMFQGGSGLDESDLDFKLAEDFSREDKVEIAVLKAEVADLRGEVSDLSGELQKAELVYKSCATIANDNTGQLKKHAYAMNSAIAAQRTKLGNGIKRIAALERIVKPKKPVKRATRKRKA